MPRTKPSRPSGDYQARAKSIRNAANADPKTVCWLCGKAARPGDPWVANRGITYGIDALLPAHRSCSSSAGAKRAHQQSLATLPDSAADRLT